MNRAELSGAIRRVHEQACLVDRLIGVFASSDTLEPNLDLLKIAQDEAEKVSGGLENLKQLVLSERRARLGPDGGK